MGISIIVAIIVIGIVIQHLLKLKEEREERKEYEANNYNPEYDNIMNALYDSTNESNEDSQLNSTDSMKQEPDNGGLDTLNQNQPIMDTTNNIDMDQPDILALMMQILKDSGCQPEINEDDNLFVKFQGESFQIQVIGVFVHVWDPFWFSVQSDNSDLPLIREAVNATNFDFGPTLVISNPDEEGVMYLHSRMSFILHPSFPNIEGYVLSMLNSFFEAKERFRDNVHKLKTHQGKGIHLQNGFTLYDQN